MRPSLLAVPSLLLACVLAASAAPATGTAAGATPARSIARSSGPRMALPFIRDDYPRALAEARARTLPLFIEAWAPW
jgi:hypothetical protein